MLGTNASYHYMQFHRNLVMQTQKNCKKPHLGPDLWLLGPRLDLKFFFSKIRLCQSLDIMVTYHHVQYQKKLIIQSWENLVMDRWTNWQTDRQEWFLKKNFMAPFYGCDSTASRLEPLRGSTLIFTSKFLEFPGTNFINLRKMKSWVDLEATQGFWKQDLWIEDPAP